MENGASHERKRRSLLRLMERYEGKRDLLATWDAMPEITDPNYRNDLKRRLQTHKNDLIYRGAL
jgi:hypothetical protein